MCEATYLDFLALFNLGLELRDGFSYVQAHVRHRILMHLHDHGHELTLQCFNRCLLR